MNALAITNYAVATLVLPDNRVLLRRQRLNTSSVTQWQATAEYLLSNGQLAKETIIWKLLTDFGIAINGGSPTSYKYDVRQLSTINIGPNVRSITSYVIKVLTMWNFQASRIFEFHAKPFRELLDDIYQNSVAKPGSVTGFEKHSFNTVRVVANMDKIGVLR
jgi:hypothetical protein